MLGILAGGAVHAAPPPRIVPAHKRYVTALAFSPNDKQLYTASDDGTSKRWDAATGKLLAESKADSPLTALIVCPKNNRVITGAWNGSLRYVEIDRAVRARPIRAHTENITALALSADGRWLATGSGDDTARIWDTKTDKPVLTIEHGNEYDVTCLAFDPAGKWLLTGDGEGTVRFFDTVKGQEIQRFQCHEETIAGAAVLDNGKKFLTASWDDTIKVWDAVTGTELQALAGHTDDVTCAALSRDGKTLVTGSADRTVRCWDIATGKAIYTSSAAAEAITAVAITSGGERVAAGSGKNLIIHEVR
jgi:WD40 repeat protein